MALERPDLGEVVAAKANGLGKAAPEYSNCIRDLPLASVSTIASLWVKVSNYHVKEHSTGTTL